MSDRTYTTLVDRARPLLALGESVVIDGSWSQARWRTMAAGLAESTSSEMFAFRCDAPEDLRRARAGEHAALGTDASDAGPELATVLGARFPDWPEATVVDTTSSREDVAAGVIRALATPRCALTPHST